MGKPWLVLLIDFSTVASLVVHTWAELVIGMTRHCSLVFAIPLLPSWRTVVSVKMVMKDLEVGLTTMVPSCQILVGLPYFITLRDHELSVIVEAWATSGDEFHVVREEATMGSTRLSLVSSHSHIKHHSSSRSILDEDSLFLETYLFCVLTLIVQNQMSHSHVEMYPFILFTKLLSNKTFQI